MKRTKAFLFLATILVVLIGVPVFAQQTPQATQEPAKNTEQTTNKLTQASQREGDNKTNANPEELRLAGEKCRGAQVILQKHLDSSSEVRTNNIKRQQDSIKVLTNIVVRLDNTTDLNVSDLRNDIKQLSSLSAKFETDFANYQSTLRKSVNLACVSDSSNLELKKATSEIRTLREQLKIDVEDFADYTNDKTVKNLEEIGKKLKNNQSVSSVKA